MVIKNHEATAHAPSTIAKIRMAEEIFIQLQSGTLDYAANLTSDNQLAAFCDWLVNQ